MARILIVDDDMISLMYMENILKNLKHEVCGKAKSGPEAVAKAGELIPDLIFMDIAMPGEYDGIEAARRIESALSIPIIFITAFEIDSLARRIKDIRPFGYIMKPYKEIEVKASIYIAMYRNEMENKLGKALDKYKEALYAQMLISDFLVELNKTYDPYEKIQGLLSGIRDALKPDILIVYGLDQKKTLVKEFEAFDKNHKNIAIPDIIEIGPFLEKNIETGLKAFEKVMFIRDFDVFDGEIKELFKKNNIKSMITFPLFVDIELYGILAALNVGDNIISSEQRKNLVSVSRAVSLIYKRHRDHMLMQEMERERTIFEQINIRKERLATLGQLTSAITHEINQPLQSIKLLSDSVIFWSKEEKNLPYEKLLDNMEKISERVTRIDRIINNLRMMVKTPEKIEIMPHNINELINKIKLLINEKLKTHGIEFALDLKEDINDVIVNDIQIEQVITDVIDNAVKALDAAKRKDKMIIIRTGENNGTITLDMVDNGPGIADDKKEKIFEPFYSDDPEKKGMGLGLYIVSNILKTFGGHISALDNEYRGATFRITLPAIKKEQKK